MFLPVKTTPVTQTRKTKPTAAHHSVVAGLVQRLHPLLAQGRITITLPTGERIKLGGSTPGIEAHLVVHHWRALRKLLSGGDVGFAKAYADGDWSSPDLTALLELAASNGARFVDQLQGHTLFRILNWLTHRRRANTRAGSRRNITFHYDLGNEFYRQWLDSSMQYSSAIFTHAGQSLEDAQQDKLRWILDLLAIKPGQAALEIGCGWGALAEAMALEAGALVTGITLSPAQLAFAQERLAREGLADRANLRIEDYRDTTGQFDRIASIEMIEAVGMEYWPSYFKTLHDRLKPGGRAVLQAITIAEDRFEAYRKQPDFIQRYIFPGGCLPTRTALRDGLAAAGLRLVESHHFADSYARTLAIWRSRFLAAWPRIEALGFDASFKRLWEYYLSYCEAGFRSGIIDVGLYAIEHQAG